MKKHSNVLWAWLSLYYMYTFSCLEIVMVKFQLDGGWGWVVVIGSFLSQVLMSAMYFSYGVVTESWIRDFNSSTATTALVGSTASGITSIAGIRTQLSLGGRAIRASDSSKWQPTSIPSYVTTVVPWARYERIFLLFSVLKQNSSKLAQFVKKTQEANKMCIHRN